MKKLLAAIALAVLVLAGLGTAWAEGEAMKAAPTPEMMMKPQTICPIMHRPIAKDMSAVYQGKRVYFCCPVCKAEFEKNPEPYMTAMAKEGVMLEEASGGMTQTTCPVLDRPINKMDYTDYQGKRIYFCCPDCKKMFEADPVKYMEKVKQAGMALEDAPAPAMMK